MNFLLGFSKVAAALGAPKAPGASPIKIPGMKPATPAAPAKPATPAASSQQVAPLPPPPAAAGPAMGSPRPQALPHGAPVRVKDQFGRIS